MRPARTACLAIAALFMVAAGTLASGHYLSPIPSGSVVLRVGCTGLWESCLAADLRVGDQVLVISKVTNTTTGRNLVNWGSIGFELDGLNYYATVREIRSGWTEPGACATRVTSFGPGAWRVKLAVPIQGDRWTDRTDPSVDGVGHAVGMDVIELVVP